MRFSLLISLSCWTIACLTAGFHANLSNSGIVPSLQTGTVDFDDQHYYLGYENDDYNTAWAKYYNTTDPQFSLHFSSGLAVSLTIDNDIA